MTIDEAIKVAEAATPGPWEIGPNLIITTNTGEWVGAAYGHGLAGTGLEPESSNANAAHVAKFDPVTVLALLRFVKAVDELIYEERIIVKFPAYKEVYAARKAVDEALG